MNKETALFAMETALKNGADNCRILHIKGSESSMSYLNGEIENLHSSSSSMLRLNIFTDGRYGVFTTNKTDSGELKPFIKNCIASCKLLEPDKFYTLPEKSLYYDGKEDDLDICDPKFNDYPAEQKKKMIIDCFNEVKRDDKQVISVANDYQESIVDQYIVDSQGLEVGEVRSNFSIGCECTVKGAGDTKPQNVWAEQSARLDNLLPGSGEKAYNRAIAMTEAGKIESGKYNIVVENTVSSMIVAAIIDALTGSAQYHKKTFLPDSLGKKIFPDILSISDFPHIKGSLSASRFDTEGVATHNLKIIDKGIISNYLTGTYFSNKLKIKRTINYPCLVAFNENSGLDKDEILQRIGKCILITGFNGGNSNSLTGDFSYGVEGFLYENGERGKAIREMNMTGNFISLWRNCLYIGNDPLLSTIWRIPTLAFAEVDMSGI